jgi:DNA-binding NtrC family response regulator
MTSVKPKILVIDDEFAARDVITNILLSEGCEVETASDGSAGIEKIDQGEYDLVITDLVMPEKDGIEVLQHLRDKRKDSVGIMATGHGSIESAITAMKAGAFDYLTKPFHLDEIRLTVNRALEFRRLQSENVQLRRELSSGAQMEDLIGSHPSIKRLKELIRTVADSDSTVLILGESGTGKELVARALHQLSDRAERPLVPVNCGAIPEDLLESELFGHVKGAFTGATMNRAGRFALADGGTIFLDEIGDMSPKHQVKVLRVLQGQTFEPVGSTQTVRVNVRVLAATNRDLEQGVRDGSFREDLFYRLNVIPLHLPPLRERAEDLALLVDHFIRKFNATKNRRLSHFSPAALAALQRHEWPGNVRELENLVERMAILQQEGVVELEHLPDRFRIGGGLVGGEAGSLGGEVASTAALGAGGFDLSRGVKNRAAQLLGIKRTTLVEKLKKYGRVFESQAAPVEG